MSSLSPPDFDFYFPLFQAAELAGQSAEEFYSAQLKELTGLTISPTFTDLTLPPGTFSFQMKITVEWEMMESIRKMERLHLAVADSYWSLLLKNFRMGEEFSVTRTKLSSILEHINQGRERINPFDSIISTQFELASLISSQQN